MMKGSSWYMSVVWLFLVGSGWSHEPLEVIVKDSHTREYFSGSISHFLLTGNADFGYVVRTDGNKSERIILGLFYKEKQLF